MTKRILITSIWTSDAIKIAITKIPSIDEVIYLISKDKPKQILDSIDDLKKSFGRIIQFKELEIDLYDIPKIVSRVCDKIDQLNADKNEIIIHISEGRKTLAFGLLFASYLRKDKIKNVYYVIKEKKELLPLPLLSLSINDSKKAILLQIMNGNEDKEKIQNKLALGKSIVYQYLNELKLEGYIFNESGKLKITDLGRIVIL